MSYKIIKNNKNLEFKDGPLKGKVLHPLWLRERINDKEYLDKNNLQRLYEPSLLESNLEIKDFSIEGDFLKVIFTDTIIGNFLITDFSILYSQYPSP